MRTIILLFFLCMPCLLGAQSRCVDYDTWLKKGEEALIKDPLHAFTCFKLAQLEARLCKIKSTAADDGISKAFTTLAALKKKAEDAQKKAIAEKKKAIEASDNLKNLQTKIAKVADRLSEEERKELGVGEVFNDSANRETFERTSMTFIGASVSKDTSTQAPNPALPKLTYGDKATSTLSFYVRSKKVIDSLALAHRRTKGGIINKQDDEAAMANLMLLLDADVGKNLVTEHLHDSTRAILQTAKETDPEYDFLVYTYLKATLYYAWDLSDSGKFDLAKVALDHAEEFINSFKKRSAIIYSGIAGIKNSYFHYYNNQNRHQESLKYIGQAIENGSAAVSKNPYNPLYQRHLSTLLRNATHISDSVLTTDDKAALRKLSCLCSDNIEMYFPGKGISIESITTCTIDESDNYIAKGDYYKAILLLKNAISVIDRHIQNMPDKKTNYLLKTKLLVQIGETYNYYLKDFSLVRNYLDSGITCMSLMLKDEKDPITNFLELEDAFDKTTNMIVNLQDGKKEYLEKLLNMTNSIDDGYLNIKSIGYLMCIANMYLGAAYQDHETKADSATALNYFLTSISVFERHNLLTKYQGFSEDITKFCKAYSETVKIAVSQDNAELAKKTYERMMALFSAYYKEYSFDFYFIQRLKTASSMYGAYLHKNREYARAIPVLELASYEGHLASSEKLIDIYRNKQSGLADTAKLSFITTRKKYQGSSMRKISIPIQFGQTKSPFDFYVVDRDPLYRYKGIEDQVEWIKIARGGVVPDDVREQFKKLQSIAWANEVSFADLSVYALEETNREKIAKKYQPLKDSIEYTSSELKRAKFHRDLYNLYENDIKAGTDKEDITKDAVKYYNQYASYLLTNNRTDMAVNIVNRTLELDPENEQAEKIRLLINFNKDNDVEKIGSTTNVRELITYLSFYLEKDDTENAEILTNKILAIKDDAKTRDEISETYMINTGDPNFDRLFLSNKNNIEAYRKYFLDKEGYLPGNKAKRQYYFNMIKLDNAHLAQDSSINAKRILSQHYNSLVWYSILTNEYDNALHYLEKSVQYDPTSLYPYSNFPHIYLFKNEFEKAKEFYLRYKDLPFDKASGYATFREAFLADFEEFEKAGLMNDDIKEIIRLLNGK